MRILSFSILALTALCTMSASADPVLFQPEGCDFQLAFPSSPNQSQVKTSTDRGDTVITNRAELHLDLNGKANIFRAECTKVPHMGFVDEAILKNNMNDLGNAYKVQNFNASIEKNAVAGPVGRLHGKAKSGGKDIVLEIYRYTGPTSIFDVWIAAEPDAFPLEAQTAFLKSIKLNGQNLQ